MRTFFCVIIIIFLGAQHTSAQDARQALIKLQYDRLILDMDNSIQIVAQQAGPVRTEQVSAKIEFYEGGSRSLAISGDKGNFYIHPDTLGRVLISVHVGSGVIREYFVVKPITAVVRLSRFTARSTNTISAGFIKVNDGLTAYVECCGFDAKCEILGFEIIRISKAGLVSRCWNTKGRFTDESLQITQQSESGDTYIFRKIAYQCPGSAGPQQAEDMSFEIE